MRKIDLIKVFRNVLMRFWIPVLLAVLGIVGMLMVDILGRKAIWDLDSRYTIYIENENAYEGYLYRKQLTQTVGELLNADIELREMTIDEEDDDKPLLKRYSINWANRRIELRLRGEEEKLELMNEIHRTFEEKAKEYLEIEAGDSAVLELDRFVLEEDEKVSKQLPKAKTILLGGMVGFCGGMALLLLKEYVRSPKVKSKDDE